MWNLEGMQVVGMYMNDIAVSGTVDLSRVKYGGEVSHHVVLDNPINVYGAIRERVILNHSEIVQVRG
jgi:hypothetical protein